jgi:hypothetical protein
MQKYRRFGVNLKGHCARSPAFTVEQRRIVPQNACAERAVWVWIGTSTARAQLTLSSRNHGDFPAILSEISRNSRYFCAG